MPEMPTDNQGERKPIPDPTTLTTEQLHREADSIRREMGANLRANEKSIEALEKVLSLRLDVLEAKTQESGHSLNRVAQRFPMVVGYVVATSLIALVLFVVNALQ